MADLGSKRTRERLKRRREPYWQRLHKGAYLGFRTGAPNKKGKKTPPCNTWVARYRNGDGQAYHALTGAESYDDAKRLAEAWFEQMGAAPVRRARRGTVRDALDKYLTLLREQGRDDAAADAEQRFKLIIWNDPVAAIPLQSLTRDDFREWRDRLRPGRLARTVNRHVGAVVAGLNLAHGEGHVGTPESWRLPALADDGAEGETAVFLTPEQRKALIAAANPAIGAFLHGLELTGARPGELAKATVSDLDTRNGTIRLAHRKGRPPRLRVRVVVLSAAGRAFFKKQAGRRAPDARLFVDSRGVPWTRHTWADDTREAIADHNKGKRGRRRIPSNASAYSFRHARISELLQIHGVDPLTVAQQTGTSSQMLERAYFKFIPSAMAAKLKAIDDVT